MSAPATVQKMREWSNGEKKFHTFYNAHFFGSEVFFPFFHYHPCENIGYHRFKFNKQNCRARRGDEQNGVSETESNISGKHEGKKGRKAFDISGRLRSKKNWKFYSRKMSRRVVTLVRPANLHIYRYANVLTEGRDLIAWFDRSFTGYIFRISIGIKHCNARIWK